MITPTEPADPELLVAARAYAAIAQAFGVQDRDLLQLVADLWQGWEAHPAFEGYVWISHHDSVTGRIVRFDTTSITPTNTDASPAGRLGRSPDRLAQ